MANFSAATAVVPRATAGEFDVDLDPQWALEDKPNGGYLLAVLGRAAATLSGHPHLTAISGSFVQSPKPGPAVITAELLRAGRGATQLRARQTQDGLPRVEALVTQGVHHVPARGAAPPRRPMARIRATNSGNSNGLVR